MSAALDLITAVVVPHRIRAAYFEGVRDGGLSLLGQPLGVEAVDGPATNMLVGHPFLLSIEWLDGEPPEPHLELARRFAIKARDRMREGEQLGEPPWWLPVDRKGRS